MPSSATREVIAIVWKGKHVAKKQIVEKSEINPHASPFSFPDSNVLNALASQVDPSQPRPSNGQSMCEQPPPSNKGQSHLVSVSSTCACHVNTHLPLLRPKSRSGFQIKPGTFTGFFVRKLFKKNPVLHAHCLRCTVVSVVIKES